MKSLPPPPPPPPPGSESDVLPRPEDPKAEDVDVPELELVDDVGEALPRSVVVPSRLVAA